MKLHSIIGSVVISLCLLLEIPVSAASLNCRIVETQGEDVTQKILNQMKDMSRHITVGGATLALIGTIGGGRNQRFVQITGAAVSLLGAVFSEAETIAEAKNQPLRLCEITNEPGKFVIGPPGATAQFARDRSAVVLPPSQGPLGSSKTGLHFTEKGIDALLNHCDGCSRKYIQPPPPPTR
jgi:type III secretory pathway component EscV